MAEHKPTTAAGYSREQTEQVEAVALTVATILHDQIDDLCVVGGLVPSMLIDRERGDELGEEREGHCGTLDLDVGLSIVLLDDRRYAEIVQRLREADFEPDENETGRKTRQRWKLRGFKVTIDFLIAPLAAEKEGGDLQDIEGDFAAIVAPGLQLAFSEQVTIHLQGRDLRGDLASREIHVCGPGAFTVLKAHAFRRRGLGKDAYDLVYVLRHWPGGAADVAGRLGRHLESDPETVADALEILREDFASIDHLGPRRAARFEAGVDDDEIAADAHGAVDDLLWALPS